MLAASFWHPLRVKARKGTVAYPVGAPVMEVNRCSNLPAAAATTADTGGVPSFRRQKRDRPLVPKRHNKPKRRRTAGGDEIRRWVSSPRDLSAYKDRVVIVSYNVLGVENVSKHLDLYNQVSQQHLNWDRRKKCIHRELRRYDPSIICFQEVDRFEDLRVLLEKDGYRGVYKHRTGEASDGCAIFWKKELFTLLHEESIEFRKFGLRDNVAQLCLFKVRRSQSNTAKSKHSNIQQEGFVPGQTLLVGNIHVLFNPNRGDIKLGQIRMLLEKADTISREWDDPAIVIAGDLNSIPQSAIYQLLSSPELDILTYDRKRVSGQIEFPSRHVPFTAESVASRSATCISRMNYKWSEEEIYLAAGNRGCNRIRNPFKLLSAYVGVPGNYETRDSTGEPLATSFHSKFMGTVDYIWHCSSLVPTRVVETLPINDLRSLGGLPSKHWGSDHLALVCELAFVNDHAAVLKDRPDRLERRTRSS